MVVMVGLACLLPDQLALVCYLGRHVCVRLIIIIVLDLDTESTDQVQHESRVAW
jgi:hypothetical protein